MTDHLGPLELVGDRWIIGDAEREGGSCLVLGPEGIAHHEPGAPEPPALVPWSRFIDLQIHATYRAWLATRTMGVVGVLGHNHMETGRSGCSVRGTLRHPYENWSVNYTHHERPYTSAHLFSLRALCAKASRAKAPHRLGDPEWLGLAVARLAPLHGWRTRPQATREVNAVIDDLGF